VNHYVQTPENSRFGGLILPQETLSAIVRQEVAPALVQMRLF
jgi:hypothetical protein